MTCTEDHREHVVTDQAFLAGQRTQQGVYHALCGHLVAPRALTAPPGQRCPHCLARASHAETLAAVDLRAKLRGGAEVHNYRHVRSRRGPLARVL